MSQFLPKSVRALIEEFSKLPGIGQKSAQRLAMHLLKSPHSKIEPLGKAVLDLKEGILFCEECWNIADSNPCSICTDSARDHGKICVVEEILDAAAIERTGDYDGLYHVLHGVLSPVDGVGVEELKIRELIERVKKSFKNIDERNIGTNVGGQDTIENAKENLESCVPVREIIMATNPSLEGEATALYIQKQLREFDVQITRIARGIPTGGDIEYSDELTLSRALKGRGEL
ncbi:MAG TPA: recombination mediator RecR [Candidatus Gracilibacteria bacterium]|nr:recombination mediator RecR [Candidatus Gracilibacteria bacterium]